MLIYIYSSKSISRYGFKNINIFVMIFTLFYIVLPILFILFEEYRDTTTLYNIVLNSLSNEEILINSVLCMTFLGLILFVYHLRGKSKYSEPLSIKKVSIINKQLYKKVNLFADILFLSSAISIIILITSVGGVSQYLALGSFSRGTNTSLSDYISSGLVPLVTFSVIILVSPYLYCYLFGVKRNKWVLFKFIVSMFFAVLYLLYNQGRAPLLLFLLPFLLSSRFMEKNKTIKLILLFIICIPLLNVLNSLFTYFSYGYYSTQEQSFIASFLLEFSYPFTNFAVRETLVDIGGFRLGIDYIYWLLALIPSSILSTIGISKNMIETLGSVNTNSYSYITSMENRGGIPVDFLTFNYYEGGYITLFIGLIVTGIILRIIDDRFIYLSNNFAFRIILLRITVSILNLMTNSDWAVIARTRTDIVILILFVLFVCLYSRMKSKMLKDNDL
ncbi:O-antigen polymerase [Terribacillus saccharophilus]